MGAAVRGRLRQQEKETALSARRKKLWGGRFSRSTAAAIEAFTHSFSVDRRLVRQDLLGSIAHARMLGKTRIIPSRQSARLVKALGQMLKEASRGRLALDPTAEDVHSAIQLALKKRIGQTADFLHTGRSRNDQVVTNFRLFCKETAGLLTGKIRELQKRILAQARRAGDLILPGYTHLRHAQPMLAAHLLLSYLHLLERDRERLAQARERLDELPLGSGALVGTGLPIDRKRVAKELGFSKIARNSVDAVTSRDFAGELLADLGLLGQHLSRIAEDLILWSTQEFGFLQFQERLLTGSSMMPQKQNPDFLELIRAGAARITGNFAALSGIVKGLPSGYHRDLQMDKELVFEAADLAQGMLQVLIEGISGIRWNRGRLAAQLADEALYATDLAEFLVGKGIPFASAHRAIGELMKQVHKRDGTLRSLPLHQWRRFSPAFDATVYRLLDPAVSVNRKRSLGSTQPAQVQRELRNWKAHLRCSP